MTQRDVVGDTRPMTFRGDMSGDTAGCNVGDTVGVTAGGTTGDAVSYLSGDIVGHVTWFARQGVPCAVYVNNGRFAWEVSRVWILFCENILNVQVLDICSRINMRRGRFFSTLFLKVVAFNVSFASTGVPSK